MLQKATVIRKKWKSISPKRLRCDVLIMVTTPSEVDSIREISKRMGITPKTISSESIQYLDIGQIGNIGRVFVVQNEMGSIKYRGSTSIALLGRLETSAQYVICIGMAFGSNLQGLNQKHGDVLVSTCILPYDSREITSDYGIPKENFGKVLDHQSSSFLQTVLRSYSESNPLPYTVHFGAMLSGSAKIRCSAYRQYLSNHCKAQGTKSPVIGGEMEGVGLLSLSEKNKPIWIVVKGISDFATENQTTEAETHRKMACENSASFVLSAFKNWKPPTEDVQQ